MTEREFLIWWVIVSGVNAVSFVTAWMVARVSRRRRLGGIVGLVVLWFLGLTSIVTNGFGHL